VVSRSIVLLTGEQTRAKISSAPEGDHRQRTRRRRERRSGRASSQPAVPAGACLTVERAGWRRRHKPYDSHRDATPMTMARWASRHIASGAARRGHRDRTRPGNTEADRGARGGLAVAAGWTADGE
jgi:hypothetical protein